MPPERQTYRARLRIIALIIAKPEFVSQLGKTLLPNEVCSVYRLILPRQ